MTEQKITADDVQQTLQGYLTAATSTGALRGAHVQFAADFGEGFAVGPAWADALPPGTRPVAARATVHRDGWAIPTVVTELWDEVVPAEESWRALWEARPHVLFGAHALRSALRRTFADVLGDRREPDDAPSAPRETATPASPTEPVAPVSEPVDWSARIAAAATLSELNDVRREARAARAVDLKLKDQLDARRAELEAAQEPKPRTSGKKRRARRVQKPTPDGPVSTSVADAMREALAKQDGETS
ncbi:hypothetical protein [Microbacterium karelineae]|uniref:hypothetical protein n=1 Tax=Microbacterium karelineae TaxID=2654283 RepID=UPI0012E9937B|nr:hypothetical protein [Microbacterium karelineae]